MTTLPLAVSPLPFHQYMPFIKTLAPAFDPAGFANCRYGTSDLSTKQNLWLPTFGVGWDLNFGSQPYRTTEGIEFARVIRVQQNKNGCEYLDGFTVSPALTEGSLGAMVDAAPGALWIVGNEPDRGPGPPDPNDPQCENRVQDDTYPQWYAQGYHDVYYFIKQRDPAAQVAVAGLVEVTPGRLQYLDIMWQTYVEKYHEPMPVDVWNMHLYILPEARPDGSNNGVATMALGTDPALAIRESGDDPAQCANPMVYCWAEQDDLSIFAEQVVAMRTWMKNHGQQNKPLVLSEYSILFPVWFMDEYGNYFTPERIANFMTDAFAYLESASDPNLGYPRDNNKLIQQHLWFSVNVPLRAAGSSSNLVVDEITSLTPLGRLFKSEIAQRPRNINLLPDPIALVIGFTAPGTGGATVNLAVDVRNNGNIEATFPFTVRFYADSALLQPIGSAVINEAISGCARRVRTATVAWGGLQPGIHRFWVKVDATGSIAEENEGDNVTSGLVMIDPIRAFLPQISR
jgi:hypothetical protein